MNFIRKEQLLQDLLLVDGVGRSGKVMLAEILTCLERVQKQEYHEFLEYIPLAYKYGKVERICEASGHSPTLCKTFEWLRNSSFMSHKYVIVEF